MKPPILVAILSLAFCAATNGQIPDPAVEYREAYTTWERVAYSSASGAVVDKSYEDLRLAWQSASVTTRAAAAYDFARAALRTARLCEAEENHQRASTLLGYAGEVAKTYPVVLSRGKSQSAFQDTASLHARVVAATNNDPLVDAPTGYELGRENRQFYAIQVSEPGERTMSEASPTELTGLAPDEIAGTLLIIDQDGKVRKSVPIAVRQEANKTESIRARVTAVYLRQEAGAAGPASYTRIPPEKFFSKNDESGESGSGITPTTNHLHAIKGGPLSDKAGGRAEETKEKSSAGTSTSMVWQGVGIVLTCLVVGIGMWIWRCRRAN